MRRVSVTSTRSASQRSLLESGDESPVLTSLNGTSEMNGASEMCYIEPTGRPTNGNMVQTPAKALSYPGAEGQEKEGADSANTDAGSKVLSAAEEGFEDRNPGCFARTFPEKLMDMLSWVESKESDDAKRCIKWVPHGKCFQIANPHDFTEQVLPKFFKQSKFKSFTRKLYRWGFRQINTGPDTNSYFHESFVRDEPKLCAGLKCHYSEKEREQHKSKRKKPVPPALVQHYKRVKYANDAAIAVAAAQGLVIPPPHQYPPRMNLNLLQQQAASGLTSASESGMGVNRTISSSGDNTGKPVSATGGVQGMSRSASNQHPADNFKFTVGATDFSSPMVHAATIGTHHQQPQAFPQVPSLQMPGGNNVAASTSNNCQGYLQFSTEQMGQSGAPQCFHQVSMAGAQQGGGKIVPASPTMAPQHSPQDQQCQQLLDDIRRKQLMLSLMEQQRSLMSLMSGQSGPVNAGQPPSMGDAMRNTFAGPNQAEMGHLLPQFQQNQVPSMMAMSQMGGPDQMAPQGQASAGWEATGPSVSAQQSLFNALLSQQQNS